jgi:DnaK suppressor protein
MAMDPLDIARVRKTIEDRLAQLRGEIADKLGDAALVTGDLDHNADSGDLSVALDTMSADFADARRDIQEYQAGRRALSRLDAGEYGSCIDCGVEIPAARLRAQPFASRCVACQDRAERTSGIRHTSM